MFILRCAFWWSVVCTSIVLRHGSGPALGQVAEEVGRATAPTASAWCVGHAATCAGAARDLAALIRSSAAAPAGDVPRESLRGALLTDGR